MQCFQDFYLGQIKKARSVIVSPGAGWSVGQVSVIAPHRPLGQMNVTHLCLRDKNETHLRNGAFLWVIMNITEKKCVQPLWS